MKFKKVLRKDHKVESETKKLVKLMKKVKAKAFKREESEKKSVVEKADHLLSQTFLNAKKDHYKDVEKKIVLTPAASKGEELYSSLRELAKNEEEARKYLSLYKNETRQTEEYQYIESLLNRMKKIADIEAEVEKKEKEFRETLDQHKEDEFGKVVGKIIKGYFK